jgi:hypothetical protein
VTVALLWILTFLAGVAYIILARDLMIPVGVQVGR